MLFEFESYFKSEDGWVVRKYIETVKYVTNVVFRTVLYLHIHRFYTILIYMMTADAYMVQKDLRTKIDA